MKCFYYYFINRKTMSTEQLSSTTTACTNAQELIVWNEEFLRGVKGILKLASVASTCNENYILWLFTKLKDDTTLDDEEKINLLNFVQHPQVAKAGQTLLSRLWNGIVEKEWGIDVSQGVSIFSYLKTIFAEDGYKKVSDLTLDIAWVDVSDRVSDTVGISPEKEKTQLRLNIWIENHQDYDWIEEIRRNVSIWADGSLLIQTDTLGKISLWTEWHKIGGQDALWKNIDNHKYWMGQIWEMIHALGGEKLNGPFNHQENSYFGQKWQKIAWGEVSSFLSEVANIELQRFYLSSSRHENFSGIVWGFVVYSHWVYVLWARRDNDEHSSLSSENSNPTL